MVKFQGYLVLFFFFETGRFPWMLFSPRSAKHCFLSVIWEEKAFLAFKICIVYYWVCKRSLRKSV